MVIPKVKTLYEQVRVERPQPSLKLQFSSLWHCKVWKLTVQLAGWSPSGPRWTYHSLPLGIPPKEGAQHFDASWNLSAGFVLRSYTGEVIAAGARSSSAASSHFAEALAACWAIEETAPFIGDSGLCIEGDSISISALELLGGKPGCLFPALLKTRKQLAGMHRVHFSFGWAIP